MDYGNDHGEEKSLIARSAMKRSRSQDVEGDGEPACPPTKSAKLVPTPQEQLQLHQALRNSDGELSLELFPYEILYHLGFFLDPESQISLTHTNSGFWDLIPNDQMPLKTQFCEGAAKHGYLNLLKWGRDNGCVWNRSTCAAAANSGHLEILQWARANDCPWDSLTCSAAAYRGYLDILKWARRNGCNWDKYTCCSAALGGKLEVLKWARQNGCVWDRFTLSSAEAAGHNHVVRWAIENGCDWYTLIDEQPK